MRKLFTSFHHISGYTFGSLDQNANVGSSDVFLSKFDNSGKLLWTKARGTSSWDYARALDIDTVGNIFLAGACNDLNMCF